MLFHFWFFLSTIFSLRNSTISVDGIWRLKAGGSEISAHQTFCTDKSLITFHWKLREPLHCWVKLHSNGSCSKSDNCSCIYIICWKYAAKYLTNLSNNTKPCLFQVCKEVFFQITFKKLILVRSSNLILLAKIQCNFIQIGGYKYDGQASGHWAIAKKNGHKWFLSSSRSSRCPSPTRKSLPPDKGSKGKTSRPDEI